MEKAATSMRLTPIWKTILAAGGIVVAGLLIWGLIAGARWVGKNLPADTSGASVAPCSAVAPGPTCDHGAGIWVNGEQASDALQCRSDGTLVMYTPNSTSSDATMYWQGSSPSADRFPANYEVDAHITFPQ